MVDGPRGITISAQNTIPSGGSVTLTAVGGPLSDASWLNIITRIKENTGKGANWITGIEMTGLTLTLAGDGVTATLSNGSTTLSEIFHS